MRFSRRSWKVWTFVAWASLSTCDAKLAEEVVELPVTVSDVGGREVSHAFTVTVFRDDARAPAPFLVLNHGRPARAEELARLGRVRYAGNARYFVAQGFVVFVPTRVGYGVTGGKDVEFSGACAARNYPPVPAFEDFVRRNKV